VFLAVKVNSISNNLAKVNSVEVKEETLHPMHLAEKTTKSIMECEVEGGVEGATQLNYEANHSINFPKQKTMRGRRGKVRNN